MNSGQKGHQGIISAVIHGVFSLVSLVLVITSYGLYFGPSRLTKVKAVVPFEQVRPAVFAFSILIVLISLTDGFFALRRIRREGGSETLTAMRSVPSALLTVLVVLGNAALSFLEIELINNYYLLKMKPPYIFLGIGITFFMYLIILTFTNHLAIGMQIGNVFFLVWAMVNYFVQQFRGIPFQWIDFGSIRTAASVSGNYRFIPTWQMLTCVAVTAAVCGFYAHRKTKRLFAGTPGKIAVRGAGILLVIMFYVVIFRTSFLANTGIWLRDWQPWYTYRLFGMESGFFAFAKASFPEAPEGYSRERVREIVRASEEEAQTSSGGGNDKEIPENIIVIMNESYSDLRIYPSFETSEPLMPFYDALKTNTQKGRLLVSVKGGTTANTEYEFLTGNSCVLSPSTVVYNSFIKQDQFTIARALKAQGYTVRALHPYGPHGWNRDTVYPRMGFDEFLSIENCFADAERVRGFVSDRADYEELIRQVEEKEKGEKLFLFNITMQNHSQYKDESFANFIDVTGYNGENKAQAEQYCSLLRMSDEAMAELINYFRECDEKTMILFFGDHQPEIGDDFWEYCFGKDLDDLSFEEQQMEYETCFFVWANYDIPEAEGLTMSANYLSSYLLSLTGLEMTPYQEFLFRQREEIPAMNAYGYLDADGGAHQWDTASVGAEAGKAIGDYKCLIYDELTGGASRDGTFYGIS